LQDNLDKVNWRLIWSNPSIFEEEMLFMLK
jgi:hypothetical protein